ADAGVDLAVGPLGQRLYHGARARRILRVFCQFPHPLNCAEQFYTVAVQDFAAKALIGPDDASGQVAGDPVRIDELPVQLPDSGVAEIVEAVEPARRVVEGHVPAMTVEIAEHRTMRIRGQRLPVSDTA